MSAGATIQDDFEEFCAKHPDVYAHFVRYAEEFRGAGRRRYGAKVIIERIRWHFATSSGDESFKIDNRFTSRFARKLIAERPEFAHFFETRTLRSE